MNIAMFTDSYLPRINGVSISVDSYARELSSMGHQILITCCDYSNEDDILDLAPKSFLETTDDPNINIFRVSSLSVVLSKEDKLARLSQWKKIKNQLDLFKPDLIHINSEFSIGLSGLVYGRFKLIPIVFTFHTLWEEYAANYIKVIPATIARKLGRDLVKHYLKRADEIIVPTQRIADVVTRYGIERDVDILPTGIPKSVYTVDKTRVNEFNNQLQCTFPVIKDKRILLYVGRVAKEKNLEFLISVFENVQKEIPDTVLLIVGDGPDFNNLQETANNSEYKDKILFTGYCDRNDLSYYYNLADIFVFPSVTETQGLVTVEAMMSGVPVVAIGRMGTVDVMQGDNGGFMVEPDLDQFTDKVLLLLKDKELYAKKSEEAINWSKKWSIKYLTPKLVEYYKKGIANLKKRYIEE